MTARHVIWLAVALAAAALVGFAPQGDSVVVPAGRPKQAVASDEGQRAKTVQTSESTARLAILAIRPRADDSLGASPFPARPAAVRPKAIERKPAPQPVEPSAPQPPPIPFQVVGRFVDDGREAVFVLHGDQTLVARVGDTLAGSYQVESVAPGVLTLIYLPLQLRQTLPIAQTP